MLIITADHGCDPAYPTTDHTREKVPLLVWGLGLEESVNLGERKTFADVSATVLEVLGCKEKLDGTSFYGDIALSEDLSRRTAVRPDALSAVCAADSE